MPKYVSLIIMIFFILSSQIHTNAYAEDNKVFEMKSEAAVLLDSETGAVLFEKNAKEKLYPASLTKIATAIYAIENGKLDDIVTVSTRAVNEVGTKVYLVEGEQVPLKKLIQGMLINSGNDASVAIAEHLDGSVEQFAENLNHYLKYSIGVENTHFTNPNGLFSEEHTTTAMDLALITNYAQKNSVFVEIFGTKELKWIGESWETTIITHHRLLKGEFPFEGITGGKTGFVNESKHTLATTAENGELKLTAIVLKADWNKDAYKDTEKLLEYGFTHFHHNTINKNEVYRSNNKDYFLSEDTMITEPITGAVKSVTNDGLLEIKEKKQVFQTVKLEEKKPKAVPVSKPEQITSEQSSINILYGLAVFALSAILIGVRKKNSRRKLNKIRV